MTERIPADGLPRNCPSCGAPNPERNRICTYCGSYIGEPDAQTTPSSGENSNSLPDWDMPSEDAGLIAEPKETAKEKVQKPEPAGSNPSFIYKILTWKFFLPAFVIVCFVFAYLPQYNTDDSAMIFWLSAIPGVILYLIHKATKFRIPNWILWILELLFISFWFLLMSVGKIGDSNTLICLSFLISLFILIYGIIRKAKQPKS